jgi:DNA-binding MarR family transcriptional regulator
MATSHVSFNFWWNMRTIEEILVDRDMSADEFRIINKFWNTFRHIQDRRDKGASKNRYLVGAALGTRRMTGREIDIETMSSLTGLARSSLQKTLRQMVDDGAIVIFKDPADKRRTIIKPSQGFLDLSIDMYEETRTLIKKTYKELVEVERQL